MSGGLKGVREFAVGNKKRTLSRAAPAELTEMVFLVMPTTLDLTRVETMLGGKFPRQTPIYLGLQCMQ